jgi:PAS domain S-box-containing protein
MHDADKNKEQLINELLELRRSTEQYRRLMDEMSDGYVITRNGRIVFANQRLAEMLCYAADELVGQPWKRFIEPQAAQYIEQTPMVDLPPLLAVQGLRSDGSILNLELAVRATTFNSDLAEFAIVRDITQRVQTEKELRKYRDHLEESVIERTAALAAANEKLYREITERRQVEAKLRQRNRELDLLNQVGQALGATLDLDQVLVTLLEEVRHLLDITACSVWLTEPATGELVCQHATAPQSTKVRGWRLAPGQGIAGWVTQSGQSLIVPDADADARHFKGVDQQTGLHIRAILCAPLRVKDRVIGALEAVNVEADRFKETDLTFLESLAATAAIAIENAQMFEQAHRDAETRSMLLNEVNHRVKNNLSTIIGMLYAARRYAGQDQHVYCALMNDLVGRVRGLATVHDMLSASQWGPLPLSELAAQVIHSALRALPRGKNVFADVSPSPIRVTPKQASALALCVNELTTNTAKHALRDHGNASIAVHIRPNKDNVQFEFRDDGPGYPEKVLRLEHYGAGFDLIQNIARKSLRGELSLHNDHGAVAVIRFKK